jgi:hypothetical protein
VGTVGMAASPLSQIFIVCDSSMLGMPLMWSESH